MSQTKHQKIIKVGNSIAVTLDKKFVAQAQLKAGDEVEIIYSDVAMMIKKAHKPLTLAEKENNLQSKITPEFRRWVKKTLEEDKEAMEKLANL